MAIVSTYVGNSLLPDQSGDQGRPLDQRLLARPRLGDSIQTAASADVSMALER